MPCLNRRKASNPPSDSSVFYIALKNERKTESQNAFSKLTLSKKKHENENGKEKFPAG